MSIEEYADRIKPAGVLYVDVYPHRVLSERRVEFLMVQRRPDVVMPSRWQAVSGKLRKGETIHAAFIRQVKKKTGQDVGSVTPLELVNVYYDSYYDTVMMTPAASARLVEDVIKIDDTLHVAHQWCDLEKAKAYSPWPTPRALLDEIVASVMNDAATADSGPRREQLLDRQRYP